jgi:hypothetical protein
MGRTEALPLSDSVLPSTRWPTSLMETETPQEPESPQPEPPQEPE